MARKEVNITLEDGEDSLEFRIRQMPATKQESWIIQAVLLLAGSGVDLPEGYDLQKAGQYLATHGLKALGGVDYEKARPLLDDLLTCCHRVLPEGGEMAVTPSTVDGYITDVRTLFRLRMEALKVNFDFFGSGGLSAFQQNPQTERATPSSQI